MCRFWSVFHEGALVTFLLQCWIKSSLFSLFRYGWWSSWWLEKRTVAILRNEILWLGFAENDSHDALWSLLDRGNKIHQVVESWMRLSFFILIYLATQHLFLYITCRWCILILPSHLTCKTYRIFLHVLEDWKWFALCWKQIRVKLHWWCLFWEILAFVFNYMWLWGFVKMYLIAS